jgi:hypothetical protein
VILCTGLDAYPIKYSGYFKVWPCHAVAKRPDTSKSNICRAPLYGDKLVNKKVKEIPPEPLTDTERFFFDRICDVARYSGASHGRPGFSIERTVEQTGGAILSDNICFNTFHVNAMSYIIIVGRLRFVGVTLFSEVTTSKTIKWF